MLVDYCVLHGTKQILGKEGNLRGNNEWLWNMKPMTPRAMPFMTSSYGNGLRITGIFGNPSS